MNKMAGLNNDIALKLNPYLHSKSEKSEIESLEEFKYNRKIIFMKFMKWHKIDPSCINKKNLEMRKLEDIALQDFFHISLTRGQQRLLDDLKNKSIFRRSKCSENTFIHEQVPFMIISQKYNLDNFQFEKINRKIEQIMRVEIATPKIPEEFPITMEKVSSEEDKNKADNSSPSSQTPKKIRFNSIKKWFVSSFFHNLGHIFCLVFFHLFAVSIVAISFGLVIFFFYYVPVLLWMFYVLLFLFIVLLIICPIGGISFYFNFISKFRRNRFIGQTT